MSLADSKMIPNQQSTAEHYEMLAPESVALVYVPSQQTTLDTGASFSMISENFVRDSGPQGTAVSTFVRYLIADGSYAATTYMLQDVPVELGDCYFFMNLANTNNSAFDLLLGVDFMDKSQAVLRLVHLTNEEHGGLPKLSNFN